MTWRVITHDEAPRGKALCWAASPDAVLADMYFLDPWSNADEGGNTLQPLALEELVELVERALQQNVEGREGG